MLTGASSEDLDGSRRFSGECSLLGGSHKLSNPEAGISASPELREVSGDGGVASNPAGGAAGLLKTIKDGFSKMTSRVRGTLCNNSRMDRFALNLPQTKMVYVFNL